MLKLNSWEHLAAEVLISTPRRFGKTISVSMFAAAILFAAPAVELSIYSTCKRISQKLLRNVVKFFSEIGFEVVRIAGLKCGSATDIAHVPEAWCEADHISKQFLFFLVFGLLA